MKVNCTLFFSMNFIAESGVEGPDHDWWQNKAESHGSCSWYLWYVGIFFDYYVFSQNYMKVTKPFSLFKLSCAQTWFDDFKDVFFFHMISMKKLWFFGSRMWYILIVFIYDKFNKTLIKFNKIYSHSCRNLELKIKVDQINKTLIS